MPRYCVLMTEDCTYKVYVEADNEQEAEVEAEEQFAQGFYSIVSCTDRCVIDVEEIKDHQT